MPLSPFPPGPRTWTLEEAQQEWPLIREDLLELQRLRRNLLLARQEAQRLGGEASTMILEEAQVARQDLRSGLELLQAPGIQVKDLPRGLVDFPARLGDRLVLLCVHAGEERIGFYHAEDDGYLGRRPIPEPQMNPDP